MKEEIKKKYRVYYLSGENGSDIFYVGLTKKPLEVRLYNHINGINNELTNFDKNNKIRVWGNKTEIHEIIEILDTSKEAHKIERDFIIKFMNLGYNLTNINSTYIPIKRKYYSGKTVKISEETHREARDICSKNGWNFRTYCNKSISEKNKKEKSKTK